MRVPVAPPSHRHLVVSVFWSLAILIGVWWYLVVLICISLITYDVSLFVIICLFAICISSLLRCLLRSLAHFLIGLFVFLLRFKSSLYILKNSPILDMYFGIFFPQSVVCLHFLDSLYF